MENLWIIYILCVYIYISYMGVSINDGYNEIPPRTGWFTMENPKIKVDDWGVPLFQETPTYVFF